MPRVGFEPTIPASRRAKTVHALDQSAIVTGESLLNILKSLPSVSLLDPLTDCDLVRHGVTLSYHTQS
jgi:hypothetical protein